MKEPQSPCRDCLRRESGCHSGCGVYAAWQFEHEEYKKTVNSHRAPEHIANKVQREGISRMFRR